MDDITNVMPKYLDCPMMVGSRIGHKPFLLLFNSKADMVFLSQVKNKAASRGLQNFHCVSWICDAYWFMGLCVFDLHPFCCLFIVYDVFVFLKLHQTYVIGLLLDFHMGFWWHSVCSCNTFPPLEKFCALSVSLVTYCTQYCCKNETFCWLCFFTLNQKNLRRNTTEHIILCVWSSCWTPCMLILLLPREDHSAMSP